MVDDQADELARQGVKATHLCADSRLAAPGDVFVALPGLHVDGHDFIPAALARGAAGEETRFEVLARIDTPEELSYYKHGGILPFVLRSLVGGRAPNANENVVADGRRVSATS